MFAKHLKNAIERVSLNILKTNPIKGTSQTLQKQLVMFNPLMPGGNKKVTHT